MIRQRINFFGTVQGVGFRWRARHAAALYGCTGWVRNEWDGSVTMEIQGSARAVEQVLEAIAAGPWVEITRTERQSIPVVEDESGFTAC